LRIAIVGAGIVGVAIAHGLLDEGHEVDFYDKTGFAAGASRGNAGWISHTDIMPLASPKVWQQVPGWLLDPVGPLAIRPAYLAKLTPWLTRFVAASRPSRIEASIKAITALNSRALPAWERRLVALQLGSHLRQRGILTVWSDPALYNAVREVTRRQWKLDIAVDLLDADAVRRLEPAFGSLVAGGALHPAGAHVADPMVLTQALGQKAIQRGARLVTASVDAVRPLETGVTVYSSKGETGYDRAVIAAGAWSKPLAAELGDAVPLDTERGYNITFPKGTLGLTRPVMYEGHGFVTTPLDSGDRVGGSVEFAGLEAEPNFARVDAMLTRLRRFLPELQADAGPRWMGFRPSLPDSLPVIGPSAKSAHIVYAFGHGHHGLTQAAATAEIVTALVVDRRPAFDIAAYSARRF
jgi:D-amino-acid dehydrogenase